MKSFAIVLIVLAFGFAMATTCDDKKTECDEGTSCCCPAPAVNCTCCNESSICCKKGKDTWCCDKTQKCGPTKGKCVGSQKCPDGTVCKGTQQCCKGVADKFHCCNQEMTCCPNWCCPKGRTCGKVKPQCVTP